VGYQEPKTRDYGVNLCEGCLEKQREIDRLKEENQRLKQKLNQNQRKLTEGFFNSATSNAKLPVKATSVAENQAKQGGGQVGHQGVGRKVFSSAEADECRIAKVEAESCPTCQCQLHQQSANERAIYELERERVRKVHYRIERKKCPKCQKIESGKVRNAFARVALSNELVIEVAEQHYLLGRSLGQIAGRFSLRESTICLSLKRIGEKLKPCVENLRQIYRTAEVRHAFGTKQAGGQMAEVAMRGILVQRK
jgi:hypothetical protein